MNVAFERRNDGSRTAYGDKVHSYRGSVCSSAKWRKYLLADRSMESHVSRSTVLPNRVSSSFWNLAMPSPIIAPASNVIRISRSPSASPISLPREQPDFANQLTMAAQDRTDFGLLWNVTGVKRRLDAAPDAA